MKINETNLSVVLCSVLFSLVLFISPLLKAGQNNQFEVLRVKLADWVEQIKTDMPSKSSRYAKDWLIDQWGSQKEDYRIFSFRNKNEFNKAHLPHAVNIPYNEILSGHYLDELDSMMTYVVYSDNGYDAVPAMVLMNLLDYKTYNLKFGMMDWNLEAVTGEVWKKSHALPVSRRKEVSVPVFDFPVIKQSSSSLDDLIKSRYTLSIINKVNDIPISDVKTILENWNENKSSYQIVSVRKNKDYMAAHISNAINIPLFEVMKNEQLKRLDPEKRILLYCDTGHLSELATTLLNLLGYNAQSIHYGMMGWNDKYISRHIAWDGNAKYPVVAGTQAGY